MEKDLVYISLHIGIKLYPQNGKKSSPFGLALFAEMNKQIQKTDIINPGRNIRT